MGNTRKLTRGPASGTIPHLLNLDVLGMIKKAGSESSSCVFDKVLGVYFVVNELKELLTKA